MFVCSIRLENFCYRLFFSLFQVWYVRILKLILWNSGKCEYWRPSFDKIYVIPNWNGFVIFCWFWTASRTYSNLQFRYDFKTKFTNIPLNILVNIACMYLLNCFKLNNQATFSMEHNNSIILNRASKESSFSHNRFWLFWRLLRGVQPFFVG